MSRSELLLEVELSRMARAISVSLIMTPHARLATVPSDAPMSEARARMGAEYDQLPVLRGDKVVGMVHRDQVDRADALAPVSSAATGLKSSPTIMADEPIECAIETLRSVSCLLVVECEAGQFCGLLHYADLNRQAVRLFLFLRVSALEMALAEYLRIHHPDLMEWLSKSA